MSEKETIAFLFDLDNTIIDSMGWGREHLPRLFFESVGWEIDAAEHQIMIDNYWGLSWSEFARSVGRDLGKDFTEEEISTFVAHGRAHKVDSPCLILPNVENIIQQAKTHGVKVALCSNNITTDLEAITKNNALFHYFDLIVGDDMTASKPDPEMFLYAARKFGAKPTNCVVFEDSITGIRAAQAAKIPVIGIATGAHDLAEIQSFHPTKAVQDLSHITLEEILALTQAHHA